MIIGFTVIQGILRYGSEYLNTWVGAKTTNLLKLDLYNMEEYY